MLFATTTNKQKYIVQNKVNREFSQQKITDRKFFSVPKICEYKSETF